MAKAGFRSMLKQAQGIYLCACYPPAEAGGKQSPAEADRATHNRRLDNRAIHVANSSEAINYQILDRQM